jgi:hypothetical protein
MASHINSLTLLCAAHIRTYHIRNLRNYPPDEQAAILSYEDGEGLLAEPGNPGILPDNNDRQFRGNSYATDIQIKLHNGRLRLHIDCACPCQWMGSVT